MAARKEIEFRYWSPIGDAPLVARIKADGHGQWVVGEIIFGNEPVDEPSSLFDAMHEHLLAMHSRDIDRAWSRRQDAGSC